MADIIQTIKGREIILAAQMVVATMGIEVMETKAADRVDRII